MTATFSNTLRNRTALALVAAVLAGCGLADYTAPTAAVPASFATAAPGRDVAARASNWWLAFNDAQLNSFMQAGLNRNLSVAQAVEAVNEARANSRLTGANDLPQVTVGADASRGEAQGTGIRETTSANLGVSWVLDLFGQNRNARAAAGAQLDAAYLTVDVARLTMLSEIALAYIDLRYFQESIALTRQSIESRRTSLDLTQTKVDTGSAPRLELVQAQQLVAQAEAQLPAFEVGFDQAVNRLATLTDQRTGTIKAGLVRGAPQPRPRYRASVGVPAEAIRNRPDVRVAERNYAASVFNIGVAEAAFYPSISLTGNVTPTNIINGGNITTWAFGPQINLPLFTGGANTARLQTARSQAAQSQITWRQTVLDAIEEVENALAAYSRDGRNIDAQSRVAAAAREAVSLSRTSFDIGEGEFFTVLDAERTLLEAQAAQAQAVRQQATNYVQLSVAAAGTGLPAPN